MQIRSIFLSAALSILPIAAWTSTVEFIGEGPNIPGSGSMDVSTVTSSDSITTTFSWTEVPQGGTSASIEFKSMGGFDLFYTGYTDLALYADLGALLISAAFLEKINGAGNPIKRFEGNASGADCALAGPDCFIVSGPGSYKTGSAFDDLIDRAYYPDADTRILSVNEGGFFRLTAAESTNPEIGFMSFEIRARDIGVVPLPAGLPLLLVGLGTLAVLRRSRPA